MVLVSQQGDAIGAGDASTGTAHDFLHHPASNAFAVIGFGWRVGFSHQHVAVGQHIKPARVIESFGERGHLSAWRGSGFCTGRPADCRGDIHRRNQGFVRFGQLGGRAGAVGDLQAGSFTTSGEPSGERDNENELGLAHTDLPYECSDLIIEKISGAMVQPISRGLP
ncbi:hypothetical protein EMIT0P294_30184 [Pseudomonas sp. IT-P294]